MCGCDECTGGGADLDFDARYQVAGHGGIAWYAIGYAKEWTEERWEFIGDDDADPDDECNYVYDEPEEIEDRTRVVCVMVGDDSRFTFDVDDLTPLADGDYCPECGQIGCTAVLG